MSWNAGVSMTSSAMPIKRRAVRREIRGAVLDQLVGELDRERVSHRRRLEHHHRPIGELVGVEDRALGPPCDQRDREGDGAEHHERGRGAAPGTRRGRRRRHLGRLSAGGAGRQEPTDLREHGRDCRAPGAARPVAPAPTRHDLPAGSHPGRSDAAPARCKARSPFAATGAPALTAGSGGTSVACCSARVADPRDERYPARSGCLNSRCRTVRLSPWKLRSKPTSVPAPSRSSSSSRGSPGS